MIDIIIREKKKQIKYSKPLIIIINIKSYKTPKLILLFM